LTKNPASVRTIEEVVVRSVEQMFGKFGAAEMKLRMIGLDSIGDKAAFRCALGSVEKLRAAVAMISQIEGQPAAAMVIRSSGTIKALRVRIQRRLR
jgi:RNase P/RNase MRP subunit POP5